MVVSQVAGFDPVLGVPLAKGGQLVFIFKERRQRVGRGQGGRVAILQPVQQDDQGQLQLIGRIQGRPLGHEELRACREDHFFVRQVEGFNEALAKLVHEVEGATQKGNIPADLMPCRQTGNGLVDHSLENTSSDVFFAGPIVDFSQFLCETSFLCFLDHEEAAAKVGRVLLWLRPVHNPRDKVAGGH